MAEAKRGSNGGSARAQKLTKEQRSAIAKDAAQRRWAKKKESVPTEPSLPVVKVEQPNEAPGTVAVPAVIIDAQPILVETAPIPAPPQKPAKRQSRPMPREFKSASSYAEKRLPLAIKEKYEHVGAVAKLDAEINDLLRVIKALGGSVDPQFNNQPMYQPQNPYQPNYSQGYPMGAPSSTVYAAPPADPGIDPALFRANTGPVPGAGSALPQQIPLVPNTSLGGAMDLDYTPREEEETGKLPNMGNGWI